MPHQVSLVLNSSKNIIITSAIFSRDSKNIIDYVKNNVDDL